MTDDITYDNTTDLEAEVEEQNGKVEHSVVRPAFHLTSTTAARVVRRLNCATFCVESVITG